MISFKKLSSIPDFKNKDHIEYKNLVVLQLIEESFNNLKNQLTALATFNFHTTFYYDHSLNQFNNTPLFHGASTTQPKIIYVSTMPDTLRMISNAICLDSSRHIYSFLASNSGESLNVLYFSDKTKNNSLFVQHFANQKHLINNKLSEQTHSIALGRIKNQIESTKKAIVESKYIFFDINAIKHSDAPAQLGNNPSGLTSEEANQIAYLAGQSSKNKYFIFYGLENLNKDSNQLTHNLISQMIWYYQDGSQNPIVYPPHLEEIQTYHVELNAYPEDLEFVKDLTTGHWFHKIPFELQSAYQEYQWIMSDYNEYLEVSNEDLPYRLLDIYESFSSIRQ